MTVFSEYSGKLTLSLKLYRPIREIEERYQVKNLPYFGSQHFPAILKFQSHQKHARERQNFINLM